MITPQEAKRQHDELVRIRDNQHRTALYGLADKRIQEMIDEHIANPMWFDGTTCTIVIEAEDVGLDMFERLSEWDGWYLKQRFQDVLGPAWTVSYRPYIGDIHIRFSAAPSMKRVDHFVAVLQVANIFIWSFVIWRFLTR